MTALVPGGALNGVDSPVSRRPGIRYVQIFGERCSGTNYLARLIDKNFGPVEITTSFGGKHWFIKDHEPRGRPNRSTDVECVRRLADGDDTLFLVIFRDPIDWLRSLHARPYHAPGHWNLSFADFIRKPWICWERERVNSLWPGQGPHFIEDADNVVRLRSLKIRHLINLEGAVANVAFVNYEALLDDLGALAEIADRFGIPLTQRPLLDETHAFGHGAGLTFVGPRDYPPVARQDLQFILQNLDLDLEASIGYDLPARRGGTARS